MAVFVTVIAVDALNNHHVFTHLVQRYFVLLADALIGNHAVDLSIGNT